MNFFLSQYYRSTFDRLRITFVSGVTSHKRKEIKKEEEEDDEKK